MIISASTYGHVALGLHILLEPNVNYVIVSIIILLCVYINILIYGRLLNPAPTWFLLFTCVCAHVHALEASNNYSSEMKLY